MSKIKLHQLVDQWSLGTLFLYCSVGPMIWIYRIFGPFKKDGWRKTTEVHHRRDESRYIGSLHGLNIDPDCRSEKLLEAYVVFGFREAIRKTKQACYYLSPENSGTVRVETSTIDISIVELTENGELSKITFLPDEENEKHDPTELESIANFVLKSYNEELNSSDITRGKQLKSKIGRAYVSRQKELALRIIRSTWIQFKESDYVKEEFTPAYFSRFKNSGHSVFSVTCNYTSDFTCMHLWVQASHIAIDGRESARFQTNLYKQFGRAAIAERFPDDYMVLNKWYDRKSIDSSFTSGVEMSDLSYLLEMKQKMETMIGEEVHLAGLFLWGLTKNEAFRNLKFNIPVDLPSKGNHPRTVGFIFVNPGKYQKGSMTLDSFKAYNSFILQQSRELMKRSGINFWFLETATLMSRPMASLLNRIMPRTMSAFTGNSCLALLKSGELAIPTLSENIESAITISFPMDDKNHLVSIGFRTKRKDVAAFQYAIDHVNVELKSFVDQLS